MEKLAVPIQPRAVSMLEDTYNQVFQELYPKMALLEALCKFKGEHQRRRKSDDEICEARRNFLDCFAYLCDTNKGGSTVTAAALQRLQHSNFLWLAANEGISPQVQLYAETVLSILKRASVENAKDTRDEIFEIALSRSEGRIQFYLAQVQRYARNCRMQLRPEAFDASVKHLRATLRKLSEPRATVTRASLVDLCYSMRGREVEAIRRRSKKQRDDFGELAHYIGRLGATRSSANTMVDSFLQVPSLRDISEIRTIRAPEVRVVDLDPSRLNPYEIVRSICEKMVPQNPIHIRSVLHAIVDLDLPSNMEIRNHMQNRQSIIARVHAELQVADIFSRKRLEFVGSDKYIGSSKPACYFCFNWLSSHHHGYVLPATHHRIIPGCRGPDVEINESGAVVLRNMYTKTSRILDQDIVDFLLRGGNQGLPHLNNYMSTEGSSHAPSKIGSSFQGV